jgi:hypothetical protein
MLIFTGDLDVCYTTVRLGEITLNSKGQKLYDMTKSTSYSYTPKEDIFVNSDGKYYPQWSSLHY